MSSLRLEPVLDHPIPTLCEVGTDAFTGYLAGGMTLTPTLLSYLCAVDAADLRLSRMVMHGDEPVGFALMAQRGRTTRLIVFGVIRAWQEKKVGREAIGLLLDEARQRGDERMLLECFEQNERGIRLYTSFGFKPIRRLFGWGAEDLNGIPGDLVEVDTSEVAHVGMMTPTGNWPWQGGAHAALRHGPPSRGYRLGDAYASISDPSVEVLTIRHLAVHPGFHRKGEATRLVGALVAAHPGKKWRIGQIVPEEFSPIFERNGFSRLDLNQFQMEAML